MKDMITKGTGNSRFLKSSVSEDTTWEHALSMLRNGNFPVDFNGVNSDGVTQLGSAYSKANVLPPGVCQSLGLDEETAEPKDALGLLATHPRPNLLDNWYFVGGGSQQGGGQFPINQRGETSYSGAGYTIDRWKLWGTSAAVTIGAGKITVTEPGETNGIFEYLETPLQSSDILTYSVLLDTNELLTVTGTAGRLSEQVWNRASTGYIDFFPTENSVGVSIRAKAGNSISPIAVKLELGSTQTLAHQDSSGNWVLNEVPNYQQELARCQRYQVVFGPGASALGMGEARSTTKLQLYISIPVTMRALPTIIIQGNILFRNKEVYLTSNTIAEGAIANPIGSVMCAFTVTGAIDGSVYEGFVNTDGTSKLILDANL